MTGLFPAPNDLVGTHRRLGPFGPVYEIVSVGESLNDGDTKLWVLVLETGERVEIKYSHILQDPKVA